MVSLGIDVTESTLASYRFREGSQDENLVIIMLWAFNSVRIVLYGAEFTRLYATRFGSGILPGANALRLVTPEAEITGFTGSDRSSGPPRIEKTPVSR